MAVYDKSGNQLSACYDKSGNALMTAYDKDGNIIFNAGELVRVMEYNCGSWYDGSHTTSPADMDQLYYDLQTGMIEDNLPDILCVEEYTQEFNKSGRTSLSVLSEFFPYIHEEGGDSSTSTTGRCVASKYPISDYTVHTYTIADGARYYDSCTVTVNDIEITVVVTHLPYNSQSSSSRYGQLEELIAYLQTQTRFICCGDFNMLNLEDNTSADYTNMIKPLLDAGFHSANGSSFGFLTTYSDDPTGTYTGCLDNIITSANIRISDVYVDETKLTDAIQDHADHMPLIADVYI